MRVCFFILFTFQLVANTIIREEGPDGLWLDVHIDDARCITQIDLCNGTRIRYEYDQGRLIRIIRCDQVDNPLYEHSYQWEGSQIISQTGWFPTYYAYDQIGRVIRKSNPWYDGIIEYDQSGEAIHIGDKIYCYDSLGQIIEEKGAFLATYDEMRNTTELNGQKLLVDKDNKLQGYEYDSNGNLVKQSFIYNDTNQLTDAYGEHFSYDSQGRRIKKGNTTYLYFGYEEIGSFENGECKTLKIPGIGDPIAIEIAGKPYAPVVDGEGIIRKLIDPETNTIYQENHCDIFGGNLTDAIPYAYRGKRYDPLTGLIYFGKRYYDPSLHRWLTPDPLGTIDHINLYQYIYNNPLRYWDPTGGKFWGYVIGLGEIIAGGTLVVTGGVIEVATFGAYTFGFSLQVGTGLALIGDGWARATIEAQDIKPPTSFWKNTDVYVPDRPLPVTEYGIPKPESDTPHTQLGTREGRTGKYPQAREFDEKGNPIRDIDFTDHGTPDRHPNPHQHQRKENRTGGTRSRGDAEPLSDWSYE